jgi:transcriptional regulator with XRE-family HTH domain
VAIFSAHLFTIYVNIPFFKMEGRMSLAEAVKKIRKDQGLTQAEVGKRSGLTVSYVSRIENGRIQPTTATLEKLALALGVPLSQVFSVPVQNPEPGHHCPISSSGQCVGTLIRKGNQDPKVPLLPYTEEELRLLRMADFLIQKGKPEIRKCLGTLLKALVDQTH